jgi:SAM-dependent methyltransferase
MTNNQTFHQALRPCPVCCAEEVEALHYQGFTLPEGHLLGDGYDVVHCSACGFVYADTPAKQADYDRFYSELSKYESSVSTGSGLSPQDRDRLETTADDIAAALPNKNARILDFGCAGGGLLRALRDRGYHYLHGVDPSPACAEQVCAISGISAESGSLFAMPRDLGQFDCILLTHVLEHVEDVRGALTNLLSVLSPGGLLYLEVPDATRYADFILAPFQDFNTEHINHFSPKSLDNACAGVGLDLVDSGERVFEQAPNMLFAAIFGFWRRSQDLKPREFIQDTELRPRIEEYIRRSQAIMDRYDRHIKALINRSPALLVWGTGQLTLKLLHETSLGQANITAFIDGNPVNQGKTLRGVPVLAPDAVKATDKPILVASTIHFDAISETIREKFGPDVEVLGLD